ncbi:MAG: erythromycin esterase family protein [Bacteroidales bacterium]|nr:erythromycin esterase family protein [Bacteroidales bacterium]
MKISGSPIPLVIGMLCLFLFPSCKEPENDLPEDVNQAWLRQNAVIIHSADPDIEETNLYALKDKIGEARIVGLGEANHGTTEMWGVRQKISKYLVEEMGFTGILMEAGFPNSLYINDYITRGEGTASGSHQLLGSWRYQEMRDLIDWMREYNIQHSAEGKAPALSFYGYDCAFHNWTEATNLITRYLQSVDPGEAETIKTRLENYTAEDARYVRDFFESRKDEYILNGSEKEYNTILRIAMNLEPNWTLWYNLRNDLPELNIREEANIENFNWIIENLLDNGKVIIWAHNVHVGNCILDDAGYQAQMLGSRLKEQYGDDYYVIASEFYSGRFYAWDRCDGHAFIFFVHSAALPDESTYAYHFHNAGIPVFFLDLRHIDYTTETAKWLLGPMKFRFIGAEYCPLNDEYYYDTISLPANYDGLIFLDKISQTNPVSFN